MKLVRCINDDWDVEIKSSKRGSHPSLEMNKIYVMVKESSRYYFLNQDYEQNGWDKRRFEVLPGTQEVLEILFR